MSPRRARAAAARSRGPADLAEDTSPAASGHRLRVHSCPAWAAACSLSPLAAANSRPGAAASRRGNPHLGSEAANTGRTLAVGSSHSPRAAGRNRRSSHHAPAARCTHYARQASSRAGAASRSRAAAASPRPARSPKSRASRAAGAGRSRRCRSALLGSQVARSSLARLVPAKQSVVSFFFVDVALPRTISNGAQTSTRSHRRAAAPPAARRSGRVRLADQPRAALGASPGPR